jgi:hypothetical protein
MRAGPIKRARAARASRMIAGQLPKQSASAAPPRYAPPAFAARALPFDANRRHSSRSVHPVKSVDLTPLWKDLHELWAAVGTLFGEHHFITIVCGFFAVMLTISCYRVLKSISPALVAFILLLIFGTLVLHWVLTRTEPAIFKPAIDIIAPFFPAPPTYPASSHPAPAHPAPARATAAR